MYLRYQSQMHKTNLKCLTKCVHGQKATNPLLQTKDTRHKSINTQNALDKVRRGGRLGNALDKRINQWQVKKHNQVSTTQCGKRQHLDMWVTSSSSQTCQHIQEFNPARETNNQLMWNVPNIQLHRHGKMFEDKNTQREGEEFIPIWLPCQLSQKEKNKPWRAILATRLHPNSLPNWGKIHLT